MLLSHFQRIVPSRVAFLILSQQLISRCYDKNCYFFLLGSNRCPVGCRLRSIDSSLYEPINNHSVFFISKDDRVFINNGEKKKTK